jgi:hypothetical protein
MPPTALAKAPPARLDPGRDAARKTRKNRIAASPHRW